MTSAPGLPLFLTLIISYVASHCKQIKALHLNGEKLFCFALIYILLSTEF